MMYLSTILAGSLLVSTLALDACTIADHETTVASSHTSHHCEHVTGSMLCGQSEDQSLGSVMAPGVQTTTSAGKQD